MARVFGLPVEVIEPSDIERLVPQARIDDLIGGVYLPGDGVTNPVDTTRAFAKGARARGVTICREHSGDPDPDRRRTRRRSDLHR